MAQITKFTGLTKLQNHAKSGMSLVNGSSNGIIVEGTGLDGMVGRGRRHTNPSARSQSRTASRPTRTP